MKATAPLIAALFEALPLADTNWPIERQVAWLQAAESIFRLVLEAEGRVEISLAGQGAETR